MVTIQDPLFRASPQSPQSHSLALISPPPTATTVQPVPRLFDDQSPPQPLPDWATFLMELGNHLSAEGAQGQRRTVALSLPTRTFGAVLAAAGAASAVMQRPHDVESHFRLLAHLGIGTPVRIKGGDSGIIKNLDADERGPYVEVATDGKQKGKRILPGPAILNVWPSQEQRSHVDRHRRRRTVNPHLELLDAWLNLTPESYQRWTVECLLVGSNERFERELALPVQVCRAAGSEVPSVCGTLVDIVRRQSAVKDGEPYYAAMCSLEGHVRAHLDTGAPSLVIFDGALALLRLADQWPNANWLVLLDRAENQYNDAVGWLNDAFVQRANRDATWTQQLPLAPAGIEAIGFSRH